MRAATSLFALTSLGLIVFAPANPALAFDCAKASTMVEKATCADKALLAQDDELNKAYSALRAMKKRDEQKLLAADQRDWILQRETECRDENAKTPGLKPGCVSASMEKRRRFVSGLPETGSGPGSMLWPRFSRPRGAADTTNIGFAFEPAKSSAELALNAAISALVTPHANARDNFVMQYTYGSPRLVSLSAFGAFEGGVHPNPWRGGINFDFANARRFAFADAFGPTALETILTECRQQVASDMKTDDKIMREDREKNFKRVLGDFGRWSFGAEGAVIDFDHGEINDYTEGDPQCRLPAVRVNALTKAEFPKF